MEKVIQFPKKDNTNHINIKNDTNIKNVNIKNIKDDVNIKKEKNERNSTKVFFEFSLQETINMIESLSVYKEIMLPDKYKPLIDRQIENITYQLSIQQIDLFSNKDNTVTIGKKYYFNDYKNFGDTSEDDTSENNTSGNDKSDTKRECIILGTSPTENFIKVAVCTNNSLEVIEIPSSLLLEEVK